MWDVLCLLWGNKKAKKYIWINKLHDIHKNEVDTPSQQNTIHICTPWFLFWPGSVKNGGPIHQSHTLESSEKVAIKYLKYVDIQRKVSLIQQLISMYNMVSGFTN